MEIGEPKSFEFVPRQHSKYSRVWLAVDQLKKNEFLPVHCSNNEEVNLLQISASSLSATRGRQRRLKTIRDGLTLWIGVRAAEAEND